MNPKGLLLALVIAFFALCVVAQVWIGLHLPDPIKYFR